LCIGWTNTIKYARYIIQNFSKILESQIYKIAFRISQTVFLGNTYADNPTDKHGEVRL